MPPRIDHVAVETNDPDATAGFYERILGARIVKTEGGVVWRERDREITVELFFEDPDGRRLEAITYRGGDDPRRP